MAATDGFERTLELTSNDADLHEFVEQVVGVLPFTAHLDIGVRAIQPGRAEITLPRDERFTNHIGTVHAIAELLPAETAGGLAITSELGDLLEQGYVPIAKSLRVRWTAPARGELTATAELAPSEAAKMRDAAASGERVACTLEIPVTDPGGKTVAEVDIDYVLKQLG